MVPAAASARYTRGARRSAAVASKPAPAGRCSARARSAGRPGAEPGVGQLRQVRMKITRPGITTIGRRSTPGPPPDGCHGLTRPRLPFSPTPPGHRPGGASPPRERRDDLRATNGGRRDHVRAGERRPPRTHGGPGGERLGLSYLAGRSRDNSAARRGGARLYPRSCVKRKKRHPWNCWIDSTP